MIHVILRTISHMGMAVFVDFYSGTSSFQFYVCDRIGRPSYIPSADPNGTSLCRSILLHLRHFNSQDPTGKAMEDVMQCNEEAVHIPDSVERRWS
jgi:hypothetical protein